AARIPDDQRRARAFADDDHRARLGPELRRRDEHRRRLRAAPPQQDRRAFRTQTDPHGPWSGVCDGRRGGAMNTRSIRVRLTVWHAGLLAGMLVLFGASVYLGLSHYLEWTLKEALSQQAQQIGESWLGEVGVSGESYVAGEINEHVSPKVNDRFIRSKRADGRVM